MSKKDQYKLNFSKTKHGNIVRNNCTRWGNLIASHYLSELLDGISEYESEGLLEEILNAINGKDYDKYYSLDVSSVGLQIVPPNIIIDNRLVGTGLPFPLSELKALLEEWISFCKSSFY